MKTMCTCVPPFIGKIDKILAPFKGDLPIVYGSNVAAEYKITK